LVAKIYPADDLVDEAVKVAQKIASKGWMSTITVKEAINILQEVSLEEGLLFELCMFQVWPIKGKEWMPFWKKES
jgi:enoyl-CoA hydratase/carnithine racemase